MDRQRGLAMMAVGLAVVLALAAGAAAARQAPPAVDKELRAELDKFAAAWNRADAKAMAALFTQDADVINPFGSSAQSRAGIEAFFAKELATQTKGTSFAIKQASPHLMRPDLAVEDIDVELSGGAMAPDPAKPIRDHAFLVVEKQGGHWLVRHLRAFGYMQPPPAPPAH